MKKKIILMAFILWWFFNIFLNFPDTSIIAVENYRVYHGIKKTFFQNWNFFAPPPRSNTRLYYIYTSKDGKQVNYEFFKQLYRDSKNHFPFNDSYIDVSFYMYNLIQVFKKQIRIDYQNYIVTNNIQNETDPLLYNTFLSSRIKHYDHLAPMQMLLRHAKKIAQQKKIEYDHITIYIAEEDIPKYRDRYSGKPGKLHKVYASLNYKK